MKRRALALLASLLLLGAAPAWTLANTFTVDQSNPTANVNVMDSAIDAQTFTAGRYGPLDSVDLFLDSGVATVTVSLEQTTGSPPVPNDVVLATTHRPVSTPSGAAWVRFDFANGPVVIPGHVYAIIIYATDLAQVWGTTANRYTRGRALTLYNLAWAPETTRYYWGPADWSFKTNVGLAAPTPTPVRAPSRVPSLPPTTSPSSEPAPTATPLPAPSATPAAGPATVSPAPTQSSRDASATASGPGSGPGAGSTSGTGSAGSSGLPLPIVGAGLALLALAGGGLWLMLRRRRQDQSVTA